MIEELRKFITMDNHEAVKIGDLERTLVSDTFRAEPQYGKHSGRRNKKPDSRVGRSLRRTEDGAGRAQFSAASNVSGAFLVLTFWCQLSLILCST